MPHLTGSKHTIIGRLLQGKETIKAIEGIEEYKKFKQEGLQYWDMHADEKSMPEKPKHSLADLKTKSSVQISNCGIYKDESRPSS